MNKYIIIINKYYNQIKNYIYLFSLCFIIIIRLGILLVINIKINKNNYNNIFITFLQVKIPN